MNTLKKRILFKATRRGMKETEFIFARFIEQYTDSLKEEDWIALDHLLDQSDPVLLEKILSSHYSKDEEPILHSLRLFAQGCCVHDQKNK